MQCLEQHPHAVVVLSCVEVRVSQVDVQAGVPPAVELLETILVEPNCLREVATGGAESRDEQSIRHLSKSGTYVTETGNTYFSSQAPARDLELRVTL